MATVVDAFLVQFGLDNKEFKQGAEEAEKVYEDLVKAARAQSNVSTEKSHHQLRRHRCDSHAIDVRCTARYA